MNKKISHRSPNLLIPIADHSYSLRLTDTGHL